MNQQKQISYTGPFITMVFLFFIVGFLTVVFQQFQGPIKESLGADAENIKTTLGGIVVFAWFLAYPLTGGIGSSFVTKYGYKGTLVKALMIMIAGIAICVGSVFYQIGLPESKLVLSQTIAIPWAYFIFLVGTYVVGGAVTIMQVVINPYLVACQVKGTSDVQRQNIGGALNSTGTTIAPFFVGGIVFGGAVAAEIKLDSLIYPFIILAVVIAIVAFVVNKLKLPNIEGTTADANEKLDRSIWSFRHLALGVVAIFIYVGVEVCVGANIKEWADSLGIYSSKFMLLGVPFTIAALMASLYWFGMFIGRLCGSFLSKIPANIQLAVTSVGASAFVIIAMITGNPWVLIGAGLFHSVMWPSTFSLAVRGLGKYTSAGSGALMIGVLGGGILPLIQSMMTDAIGSWTLTWIIVVVGEAYLLYYALIGSKIRKGDDMTA